MCQFVIVQCPHFLRFFFFADTYPEPDSSLLIVSENNPLLYLFPLSYPRGCAFDTTTSEHLRLLAHKRAVPAPHYRSRDISLPLQLHPFSRHRPHGTHVHSHNHRHYDCGETRRRHQSLSTVALRHSQQRGSCTAAVDHRQGGRPRAIAAAAAAWTTCRPTTATGVILHSAGALCSVPGYRWWY